MAKIGRNDPCPCGSGQKYKRCCLPRDEAAQCAGAAERAAALVREAKSSSKVYAATDADDDGLDEASNRPIDLIDAGHLDEAEQAAHDLLQRYPQVHDGLERLAMVYAARGDHIRAAEAPPPRLRLRPRARRPGRPCHAYLSGKAGRGIGPRRSSEWSGGQAT